MQSSGLESHASSRVPTFFHTAGLGPRPYQDASQHVLFCFCLSLSSSLPSFISCDGSFHLKLLLRVRLLHLVPFLLTPSLPLVFSLRLFSIVFVSSNSTHATYALLSLSLRIIEGGPTQKSRVPTILEMV